jgi:hypothetical protein
MASQQEIASVSESTMLLRNNVSNVMDQLTVLLVELAIFATLARSRTDKQAAAFWNPFIEGFDPVATWP